MKRLFGKSKWFARSAALIGTSAAIYELNEHDITPGPTIVGFFRMGEVIARLGSVSVDYALNYDRSLPDEERSKLHLRNAQRILECARSLGGVYIKTGQFLAALRNVIPDEYVDTMEVLQDTNPHVPFREIESYLNKYLGPLKDIFETFDEEAIAAASLAQVHRGTLKDGSKVAVKVQYPYVRKHFDMDMRTILYITYLVGFLYPDWEFEWIPNEAYNQLVRELDFYKEERFANRAYQDYKTYRTSIGDNAEDVYIPKVYESLSSDRIMTMEWIDGFKCNDLPMLKKHGFSEKQVMTSIFRFFAEQAFVHGHLHGDPHPGNVFVRPHPKDKKKPQVVVLDHGLYMQIEPAFRQSIQKIWLSAIMNNVDVMKEECARWGVSEYKQLSNLLFWQSFDRIQSGKISATLEGEELNSYIDEMNEDVGTSISVLKRLPHEILVILRCFGLLRSINQDVGVPVNRYHINADVAFNALYDESSMSFLERCRFYFSYRYRLFSMKMTQLVVYYYLQWFPM